MKPEIRDWLQFSVAQPVLINHDGIYPLILASQQGRADVVCFLIEQNAALDVTDQYGNNALWAACYADNSDCTDALIQAGIVLTIKTLPPAAGKRLSNNCWRPTLIQALKPTTSSLRWIRLPPEKYSNLSKPVKSGD